jgi:hypothetical protein
MAPPMKKKKKKSNSSQKKKDTWSYDGGVTIDDIAKNVKHEKGKLRHNQARDDKELRTKIRSIDRKRKKDFEEKMKKKISFTDIIKDYNANDIDDDDNEDDQIKKTRTPSSIPVIDRLRYFLKPSSKKSKRNISENSNDITSKNEGESNLA